MFRTEFRRGSTATLRAVVAALLASTWAVSCARSQFDPSDEGPVGGSGGSVNAAGTSSAAGSPGVGGSAGGPGSGGGAGSAGAAGGKGGGSGKGGSAGSTVSTGGCELVINEVCPGKADSGDPDDELIELYNAGGGACDLEGFVLEYSSDSGESPRLVWTGEAGDKVASKGFFVVGGSKFGGTADATYTMAKLGQNGGGVGLTGPSGELVDAVAWDNAKASHPFAEGDPTDSIPDGSSVARQSDGVDTADNQKDFAVGPPTPGQPN